ncbi:MAG: MCP four helix bundle domain-containing protein, partial [Bdellovibrionales bacterium]|nr:MCP four helix bundle domain-containing protein [Bdellovibrionales bacterium]
MKKKWSLSKKLMLMGVAIGALTPVLGALTYYQTLHVARIQNQISDIKLAKTKELGELIFKFRDIRIQVRTVPVRGMSWEKVDEYLENTKKAVATFLAAKKKYEERIENTDERALFAKVDSSSQDFLEFGGTLISLSSAHDQAKLDEVARLVRDVCPIKAEKVETAIAALVNQQTVEADSLVSEAHNANSQTKIAVILGSLFGFILALLGGYFVARSISLELQMLADQLSKSSSEVTLAAQQASNNGNTLSSAATQQAAALQETVSAIEEISSMISKNSDNANQ